MKPPGGSPNPNPIPPKLPSSMGFASLPGMQRIVDTARPLFLGRRGLSPLPFTAAQMGLVAGLVQIWVSHAAMALSEQPDQLPSIPQEFFEAHPGEVVQVYAHVLKFDNDQSPHMLLESPEFVIEANGHWEWVKDGVKHFGEVTQVTTTIQGGLGFQWPGYEGETYYKWYWADAEFYHEAIIIGRDLTAQHAYAVALTMGSGGSNDVPT